MQLFNNTKVAYTFAATRSDTEYWRQDVGMSSDVTKLRNVRLYANETSVPHVPKSEAITFRSPPGGWRQYRS